jgi:bifunctional non-homologous end joining protein LigD
VLEGLLKEAGDIGPVFLSDHFDDEGAMIYNNSCELGLEGIVSTQRDAPYKSGRTEAWIKVKCLQVARYEVIGYKNAQRLFIWRSAMGKTCCMSARPGPASF